MATAQATQPTPHIPVLLRPIMANIDPRGLWLDGTFGAGGYTRALLDAGADVIAVDRDPTVFDMAQSWAGAYGDRLRLVQGTFGELDQYAQDLDGVVLDLGVSSMQLDQADRGFSFMADGPLDMRMADTGTTAADLVNSAAQDTLADILFHYGEERAARRIARAIVRARPLTTTLDLAEVVQSCLPRPKPGQSHPATRSFQALRIAVNDEYGQLASGLEAAERALKPGGTLAVVTFHSIEDRMVKRFFQVKGQQQQGSRHAPAVVQDAPTFALSSRKPIGPDDQELAENPRSRSAKLRIATRTDAPARTTDRKALGMPILPAANAHKGPRA